MPPGRRPPATPPAPWLFGIASVPYGAFNALVAVALPYVLRTEGLSVDHIAVLEALMQAPTVWYFLWAPSVDVALSRRAWVLVLSAASAAAVLVAFTRDPMHAARGMAIAMVAGSVFNQPISSALAGLVATAVPDAQRGRTAGWSQAGMLGGGVLAGGAAVWLTAHASRGTTAIVLACVVFTPALAVLAVREPRRAHERLVAQLARMARELRVTLLRRDVGAGLLLFLTPVGAGALLNLFSALGVDFHASSNTIVLVVAIAGVGAPVGALIGGSMSDRFNRFVVYAAAGVLTAISVIPGLLLSLSPRAYLIDAAAYAVATGFAYAAFTALAYQLTGTQEAASGTRFTIFMAAVNLPVVYMVRLDGWAHAHFGVRGMLLVDGGSNALFGVVLLAVFAVLVRRRARRAARDDQWVSA